MSICHTRPSFLTDRTAYWWKLFVEGNYYTRHELPNRLLDIWHVTCFRVRDWVTHVIRGAGREFCQRRVGHRHSRPATTSDRCHLGNRNFEENLDFWSHPMEGEFILRYNPILEDIVLVAWVTFIHFFGKWSGNNGLYWTDTDALWRASHIPATSPLFSLSCSRVFLLYQWPFFYVRKVGKSVD